MTASSDTFREMIATAIIIKPGKSTRSHQRDIVACDTSGSGGDSGSDGTSTASVPSLPGTQFLAGLGLIGGGGFGRLTFQGILLQATSTGTTATTTATTTTDTSGNGTTAVEEDCILLTWKKDRQSDATEVRAEQRAQKIADRLTRIAEKLERSGKADRLTLIQQRADDREAKAAVRAQHKLERDQARAEGGKGGGDDKGRPDGKGKPDGKGGGQGGGGQGGGQGGGKK